MNTFVYLFYVREHWGQLLSFAASNVSSIDQRVGRCGPILHKHISCTVRMRTGASIRNEDDNYEALAVMTLVCSSPSSIVQRSAHDKRSCHDLPLPRCD
jgi:hypothetical protein